MYRMGVVAMVCLLLACSGNDKKDGDKENGAENTPARFSSRFPAAAVPYQLTDTGLLNNKDTASLSAAYVSSLVPDSLLQTIFSKKSGIRYTPLAKVEQKDKDAYYVVKASAGNKKAALLLMFESNGSFGTAIPFLVPDGNSATVQTSSIDKSFTVTRGIVERKDNSVTGEGKEVLAYDASEKKFTLIMTDLLYDYPAVLVNPIDTFPKNHRLAGDYYSNKKNVVSVRDGRYANQLLVYIHTENSDRSCVGELKGEFVLTSSSTAVYRQGGDPCVLALTFAGNTVSLQEERGCGNYRGLDCPFDGSFTRKKEGKPKESIKKAKRSKRSS